MIFRYSGARVRMLANTCLRTKQSIPGFLNGWAGPGFVGLIVSSACGVTGASGLAGQQLVRCAPVQRFLAVEQEMATRTDPDTLNDWRTGMTLPACRVTAAGTRTRSLAVTARQLYQRLRDAGWTRTPNPSDAPNESSLRLRLGETDCVFNVYSGILLGTAAELEVSNAVARSVGDEVYHVVVQCVPALEARRRR